TPYVFVLWVSQVISQMSVAPSAVRVFVYVRRSGPFRRGTLTTSRGSCPGADAKVFDACGKKFCGWYISSLDD
ncbi:hypothetical protein, partial [Escherichia coli]|uniref:hypothetical protein n=1 Tax=Escherichia coli TaxID=562 RepID=UPI001BB47858